MKKIILLTITCLLAVTAWGQSSFYKKYAGYKEVSKVYISSSLFSLMGDNSELEISSQINVAGIIQNLDGLYILSTSNQKVIAEMRKDFEKQIKSGEFEVLMEIEDGVVDYLVKKHPDMSEDDVDLVCLLCCGFSATEMSVFYNHSNGKSIYSRKRRLAIKLGLDMSLDEYVTESLHHCQTQSTY
jgi:hypothetical protein